MSDQITIGRRGQCTLPKSLRDNFGLERGQKYRVFALTGGTLVLTPQPESAFEALQALRFLLIEQGVTREEMFAELRRMREAPEERT